MKSVYISRKTNAKNIGFNLTKHQHFSGAISGATFQFHTVRPNRFGKKITPSVWMKQKGIVYYEPLKLGKTDNGRHYQQQLINFNQALHEQWPEWDQNHK